LSKFENELKIVEKELKIKINRKKIKNRNKLKKIYLTKTCAVKVFYKYSKAA